MKQLEDFNERTSSDCITNLSIVSAIENIAMSKLAEHHVVSKRADSAASTRRALISAAKKLFAEKGFAQVSTGMIAKSVGVTEGALFHHFKSKKNLYRLVVKEVHQEFQEKLEERCLYDFDEFQSLLERIRLSLVLSRQGSSLHRILQEAPFHLGYDEWRRINADIFLATLEPKLRSIAGDNNIPHREVRPLSLMLVGIMNEYCFALTHSDEDIAEDDIVDAVEQVINAWLSRIGKRS